MFSLEMLSRKGLQTAGGKVKQRVDMWLARPIWSSAIDVSGIKVTDRDTMA